MVRCRFLVFFTAAGTSVIVILISLGIWQPCSKMSVAIWQPTVDSTASDYAGMLQERMQAHAHVAHKVEQFTSTSDEGLLVASRHTDTLTMEATSLSQTLRGIPTANTPSPKDHIPPTTRVIDTAPPITKPIKCKQRQCKEYLSERELVALKLCMSEVKRKQYIGTIQDGDCSFIDGKRRLPVALVSTEGSGNTWVRGLLEKATGICTGFVYCDFMMRARGFIGENIKSGSVLVVKTHTLRPQWYGEKYHHPEQDEPHYGSAIFIIRNPHDSLIAEWNRRVTNMFLIKNHLPHNESHTNVVPRDYWAIPKWDLFLHKYMNSWRLRLRNWVTDSMQQHLPVHVVRYEDLINDTVKEVGRMLDFLNINYNKEDLGNKLRDDFTVFKREHSQDDFEHYSPQQKLHMKSVLQEAIRMAEEGNKAEILRLHEYLGSFE